MRAMWKRAASLRPIFRAWLKSNGYQRAVKMRGGIAIRACNVEGDLLLSNGGWGWFSAHGKNKGDIIESKPK